MHKTATFKEWVKVYSSYFLNFKREIMASWLRKTLSIMVSTDSWTLSTPMRFPAPDVIDKFAGYIKRPGVGHLGPGQFFSDGCCIGRSLRSVRGGAGFFLILDRKPPGPGCFRAVFTRLIILFQVFGRASFGQVQWSLPVSWPGAIPGFRLLR